MNRVTYTLPIRPLTLKHSAALPAWLGDYDLADTDKADGYGQREFNATDAMAASGDCFVTLATRIDKVAQGLPMDSAEQIELEHLIGELFYLQKHWSMIAKRERG